MPEYQVDDIGYYREVIDSPYPPMYQKGGETHINRPIDFHHERIVYAYD